MPRAADAYLAAPCPYQPAPPDGEALIGQLEFGKESTHDPSCVVGDDPLSPEGEKIENGRKREGKERRGNFLDGSQAIRGQASSGRREDHREIDKHITIFTNGKKLEIKSYF